MQPLKNLALILATTLFWNCEQPVQPTAKSPNESKIVPAVNSMTAYAARKTGIAVTAPAVSVAPVTTDNPFTADALKEMKDAGLCDNFVQLIGELSQSSTQNSSGFMSSPRFQKVMTCLENDVSAWANAQTTPDDQMIMNEVDKCFCDGTGSLFSGLRALTLNSYSAPSSPGGHGYSAPQPSSTSYSAPSSPAPSTYASPTTAPGYSAPSL